MSCINILAFFKVIFFHFVQMWIRSQIIGAFQRRFLFPLLPTCVGLGFRRSDASFNAGVANLLPAVGQTLNLKTTVRFYILPILSFSAVCSIFLPIKAAVLNHPEISFSVFFSQNHSFAGMLTFYLGFFFLNCL